VAVAAQAGGMAEPTPPTVFPGLMYRDARAAIDYLVTAFGFEVVQVVPREDGQVAHAELRLGNGLVMVTSTPSDPDSPFDWGRSGVCVVVDDPDAHFARAEATGVDVVLGLRDTPYGARDYTVRDPEGNFWTFGTYQPFAHMAPADA
jgi:uncharacterized glyoxalase superfamily protein PhnB